MATVKEEILKTEEIAGEGGGDVESPKPVEPPKVPDVELIIDGFGFMPKIRKERGRNMSKQKWLEEESPCASSTSTDIVRRYTWKTKNRMTVQVITYGATIASLQVPDRKGIPTDVVAGFENLEDYFNDRNPYFGATIGRYANIINDASMVIPPSGRIYLLSTNKAHHHYNGGHIGFDKVNWRSYVKDNKVIMSHVSERYSEGYPGTVMATITFEATCDNTFKIDMKCTTSEPTAINLSNLPYFNLAGHHAGKEAVYEHIFTINGDKYTIVDENGYVTGEKKVVGGTIFDFRVPRLLKTMLPKVPLGGYDLNYCISQGTEQGLTFHARALHPVSGRVLEVYSNQPGMQFYTGNLLPDPDKIIEPSEIKAAMAKDVEEEGSEVLSEEESDDEQKGKGEQKESKRKNPHEAEEDERSEGVRSVGYVPLIGKEGAYYNKHGLFTLAPQNYPDAVNHKNFPKSILNPGEVYEHKIQYKFGILLGRYV